MKNTTGTRDVRVNFDAPTAFLEFLYVREALALAVLDGMPSVSCPPAPRPAAGDATARWEQHYRALLDAPEVARGGDWLTALLTSAEQADDARRWARERRQEIIDVALMPSPGTTDRLNRRGSSAHQNGTTEVFILPLEGHFLARTAQGAVLVSLMTFLDEASWDSRLSQELA